MISAEDYRVDPSASVSGTSLRGTISIAPSVLVSLFGAPVWAAREETLGGYAFVGPEGRVNTIYMMAHDTPLEEIVNLEASFWQSDESQDFHVGAKSDDDADLFARWLAARVDARTPGSRAHWMSMRMLISSVMKDVPGQGSGG